MAFCKERCTEKCINARCYCGLPIFLMDHIQLPCCNKALHHVSCISKKSKCPNCDTKFDVETKTCIKNVESTVFEKLKEIEKRKQKQNSLRKHIQIEVCKIMKERIRQNLECKKNRK